MQIEREDGTIYRDPDPDTIESVVRDIGREGTSFVILSVDDQSFIQASADAHQRCDLEVRAGADASHERCTDEMLRVANNLR